MPAHVDDAAPELPPLRLRVPPRAPEARGPADLMALRRAAARAQAAGDWVKARALLVRSLELRPAQEDALTELAQACVALGQDEEALVVLGRLQHPDAPHAALLQGRALLGAGLHGPAVTVLDGLLRDLPGDVNLRVLLAEAQRRHGHAAAERSVQVALAQAPQHCGARLVLGRIWLDQGRTHEALQAAEGGLQRAQGAEAWELSLLAVEAELLLGRAQAAEARLNNVPENLQRAAPTVEQRARLRFSTGRPMEARLELEALRASGGLSGPGHLLLAETLEHMSELEPGLEVLNAAVGLTAAELPARDRLRGRILERLGDGRGAAACFTAARAGLRRPRRASALPDWPQAPQVMAAWSARRTVGAPRLEDSGGGPIFVIGPPGVGVRLVGQLLAAQSGLPLGAGPGTLAGAIARARPRPDCDACEALRAADAEQLQGIARRWWGAAPRDPSRPRVEACPENLLLLGLIAQLFPDARVVLVDRDPIDAALSAWSRSAPAPGEPEGIAELMEAGERARQLAEHWLRTSPLRMVTLRYEALVANPARTLSRVRRALDLPALPLGALLAGARPLRFGGPALDAGPVGRWLRYPALAESMALSRPAARFAPQRRARAAS